MRKALAFSLPSRLIVLAVLSTAAIFPLKGTPLVFFSVLGGSAGASAARVENGSAKTAPARTAIPNNVFIDSIFPVGFSLFDLSDEYPGRTACLASTFLSPLPQIPRIGRAGHGMAQPMAGLMVLPSLAPIQVLHMAIGRFVESVLDRVAHSS